MAAAIGVCAAATYYIMTLRVQQTNTKETINNRRATFSSNQMQFSCSEEWINRYMDVWTMEWSDFEDFKRKYTYPNTSPDLLAKRWVVWYRYDSIGRQYRSGLISLDDLGVTFGYNMIFIWYKFKSVIEEFRGTSFPSDFLSDFECVSEAMLRWLCDRDPDLMRKINESYPDLYQSIILTQPHTDSSQVNVDYGYC